MHLIRRAALRALSSSSASFISKPRSITTTSSPFISRSTKQATFSPTYRRFASDDVASQTQEAEAETSKNSATESTLSSADSEDQSSIQSAINSTTESVSTYTSEAAESLTENAQAAKDAVADAAQGAATAAGLAFAPREERSPRQERNPRDERRQTRGPRTPQRFDDKESSFGRPARNIEPSNTVYIGNLLFDITEQELEDEFSQYGKIESIKLASDARGLSKGFAYITFDSIDTATKVIEARNGEVWEGRILVLNYMAKTRRETPKNEPSRTLFIGNLAFEMSDADLNTLFRDIRNVIDVRVAIDRRTGQPRGFAHADFVDVDSAMKASEYLQGKEVYGRRLRVDYSGTPGRKRPEGSDVLPPRESRF